MEIFGKTDRGRLQSIEAYESTCIPFLDVFLRVIRRRRASRRLVHRHRRSLDNNDDDTQALGAGATGVKSILYTITDASGASSTATLFITVQGTNDAPNAVPDHNSGDVATPLDPTTSGNALINDTDPDAGDSKTVSAVSASALNIGVPVVGIYGSLTMSVQWRLDLYARSRRSRHGAAAGGRDRERCVHLHHAGRSGRHVGVHAEHYGLGRHPPT